MTNLFKKQEKIKSNKNYFCNQPVSQRYFVEEISQEVKYITIHEEE